MSANSLTASTSRSAASPSGSGHSENGPAAIDVPALSVNACRGSVDSVTGIPHRVSSAASRCRALCHSAVAPAPGAPGPRKLSRLKWLIERSATRSLVDACDGAAAGSSTRDPSGFIVMIG